MKFGRSFVLSAIASSGVLAVAAATAAQDGHTSNPVQPGLEENQVFSIEMEKGEVLQVITSELRPDGRDAARSYGQAAFPLAQSHGFKRFGQLNVQQIVRSDFAPQAISFYSWPSKAAADAFSEESTWPAIKAARPEAWSNLKIYDLELKEDLQLNFDRDKHYTVLIAWLENDEAAGTYNRYLSGIEPAVTRSGGRFLYKMRMPSMESYSPDEPAPHQLTFVEWETTDGFDRVQQTQEYLEHRKYFGSSVDRFEFYWLKTPE